MIQLLTIMSGSQSGMTVLGMSYLIGLATRIVASKFGYS
jgi:hypothetical protein